jgi:hypothetical protein
MAAFIRPAPRTIKNIKPATSFSTKPPAEAFDPNNRVTIEVGTASYRTKRGYAYIAILADEIAFWRSDDNAPRLRGSSNYTAWHGDDTGCESALHFLARCAAWGAARCVHAALQQAWPTVGAQLAVRLRLSPSSRYDPKTAARMPPPIKPLWLEVFREPIKSPLVR